MIRKYLEEVSINSCSGGTKVLGALRTAVHLGPLKIEQVKGKKNMFVIFKDS